MLLPELLAMDFMRRAFLAGLLMGAVCPLIGTFLVLRRQSLIGDGLGHIAFAGVALGVLAGVNGVLSAAVACVAGALAIEAIRSRLPEAADLVLAIFFYSGMGLAAIFLGLNRGGGFSLSSLLFGSLLTVSWTDLCLIGGLALAIVLFIGLFYRPLQYLAFDEVCAQVAGLPVARLNLLLALLTALTVALAMRIVGLLLVAAMLVLPVACALQTAKSFAATLGQGVAYGLAMVVIGLTASYYLDLAPGGSIVLTGTLLFALSFLLGRSPRPGQQPENHCAVCGADLGGEGEHGPQS